MQADTDYLAGNAGILASQAADQAELANQRYANDLIATQTANLTALTKKYYAMLVARGKNPAGVDPRAADFARANTPYGGQYYGKVERPSNVGYMPRALGQNGETNYPSDFAPAAPNPDGYWRPR